MLGDPHLLAYAVLAVLAGIVAVRNRQHRPTAAFIGWMLASDIVRPVLTRVYESAPRPLHGSARFAFHVDESIALSWYGLFVATCLVTFVGRGARHAIAVWILLSAACLFYPFVSGRILVNLYLATAITSAVAAWACILYGMFVRRDLDPGLPHLVLILYATTDVGTYLFSYLEGFAENWPFVRLANLFLLLACIVAHVVWLARHRARAVS